MDETIDILNPDGKPTGETCLKSEAHQNGILHGSVHIWIFKSDGDILLQKRANTKETFPGLWDVSVAGHIASGETAIISAVREAKEELGIFISPHELNFIGNYLSDKKFENGIKDCEFHHVYLYKTTVENLDHFILQEEEVSEINYYSIAKLKEELNKENANKVFALKDKAYYEFVLKEITNHL